MNKILLLFPPYEGKTFQVSRSPFPLGLLYIAAYLKKNGILSEVHDLSYPPTKIKTLRPSQLTTGQAIYFRWGWADQEIKKWLRKNIKKYNNIIGVSSLMSSNYTGAYSIIDIIKKVSPQSKIVIGGPHATMFPEHVAQHSKADYLCIGEGEESFLQFIKSKGKESKEIIKLSKNTKHTAIAKTNFIQDMDSLPFPDRDLLKDNRETKSLYVTFSRGCPHKCSFCGSHLIQGRIWRNKRIDKVLKELRFYNEAWGVNHFVVEDDNPCPGPKGIKYLKKICERVITELPRIKLTVSHGLPVYATADKELCKLLWKTGFRTMTFPVESTDPRVLEDMNKEQVAKHWKQAVKNWQKYEKWPPIQIIIGYPFKQTITSMLETIMDIAEIGGRAWGSWFRPNKGIRLFDRCVEAGLVSEKSYDPINTQSFSLENKHFKIQDLREVMQISRGMNFSTEYDCNPFKEILDCKFFHDFSIPKKIGDVVARGTFKFRRSQNICAAIIILQKDTNTGRPMVSFGEGTLIFKGYRPSRVYDKLRELITGEEPENIRTILK